MKLFFPVLPRYGIFCLSITVSKLVLILAIKWSFRMLKNENVFIRLYLCFFPAFFHSFCWTSFAGFLFSFFFCGFFILLRLPFLIFLYVLIFFSIFQFLCVFFSNNTVLLLRDSRNCTAPILVPSSAKPIVTQILVISKFNERLLN